MDCRGDAIRWVGALGCTVAMAAFAITCMGCGADAESGTAHLAGKVTLDGESVPANAQAAITFQPSAGNKGKAVSVPIVNGAYDSPSTPRGPVLAIMSLSIPTGKTMKSERTGREVSEMTTIALSPEQLGGIALDITGDDDNHDFPLTSAK
jgi:hypothetical protein